MTYCAALNLEAGMVFASDTRTNAGVDHVSCFRKMRTYTTANHDRFLVLLSAGNLATTQSVASLIERGIAHDEQHLLNRPTLYDAALMVGELLRDVQRRDAGSTGVSQGVDLGATLLLGGKIRGERPRLFNIYAQGNFIESSPETPFFQIGESKYGRPILDRVVRHDTDLARASKCVLISFDSTIRSNLSVGLPVDLLVLPHDQDTPSVQVRIHKDDPYFQQISRSWSEGLHRVFSDLPNSDWM